MENILDRKVNERIFEIKDKFQGYKNNIYGKLVLGKRKSSLKVFELENFLNMFKMLQKIRKIVGLWL